LFPLKQIILWEWAGHNILHTITVLSIYTSIALFIDNLLVPLREYYPL